MMQDNELGATTVEFADGVTGNSNNSDTVTEAHQAR